MKDKQLEELVQRAFLLGCQFTTKWVSDYVTLDEAKLRRGALRWWKSSGRDVKRKPTAKPKIRLGSFDKSH